MGQLLEILYDVLFYPAQAMRQVVDKELTRQGLLVFLLSVLLPSLALWLGLRDSVMGMAASALSMFHIGGSMLLWFTGTAILHLIAEFYGGQGRAKGLFAALGFAQLPRILIIPLWVLAALLPEAIRPLFMGLSAAGVLLWILALHVSALQAAYTFGKAKAVLVLTTPLLAFVLFVLLVVTAVSVQVMPWLHGR